MEERIFSIQNLSVTPITIEGVLLAQNSIMYPTIGFWKTADWRPLTTSTNIRISLTDGNVFTLTGNPNEYANAFARTANFIEENYLMLLELEKPQGQLTTTNNTTQIITEIALPNGLTSFQILVEGYEAGTNNKYVGYFNPSITVVSNVATMSPSFRTAPNEQRSGFSGGVQADGNVTANRLRVTVTGQTGRTIIWTVKILNRN